MAWIEIVEPTEAEGDLAGLYRRQTEALGGPTELTMVGSLYPELSIIRSELYGIVEACPSSLEPAERQAIAVAVVAALTSAHLRSGVEHKFLAQGGTAEQVGRLRSADFSDFSARVQQLGSYAVRVAIEPASLEEKDIDDCRSAGASDLDILDANSLGAYYAYLASVCLGLGLLDPISFG